MNLFGESLALPADERREAGIAERRMKAHRAYVATATAWKRATYNFAVNVFLPANERFLFETLSQAYETWAKATGGPRTVEARAFAGLQNRLVKEGLIVRTDDIGYRSNGQIGNLYRSTLYDGTE